jgi:hypothetical protein
MSNVSVDAISLAEVRQFIVRGCVSCQSPREVGKDCAQCGNTIPAEIVDLGVVSAMYSNPLRQWWWTLVGKPWADMRVRRANRRAEQLRGSLHP